MIRHATLNDIEKITIIEEKLFGQTLGDEFYKNDLALPFSTALLYEINDSILGFVAYRCVDEMIDVFNIGVVSEHQHQGIGKQLINHIIKIEKPKSIVLEVKKTNTVAIMFYESLGFKKIDVKKGYYDGVDALLYFYEVGQ